VARVAAAAKAAVVVKAAAVLVVRPVERTASAVRQAQQVAAPVVEAEGQPAAAARVVLL
jgi:hypothetical protein